MTYSMQADHDEETMNMDPTASLKEALEALADSRAHDTRDNLDSAAIRFRALADWLAAGGFAPVVVDRGDGTFTIYKPCPRCRSLIRPEFDFCSRACEEYEPPHKTEGEIAQDLNP